MNYVHLTGRLVKEPELRYTQTQKPVTTNTIAVKKDKETTIFIQFTAFNNNANYLCQYGKKGQNLAITGELNTYYYDDKDGKRVYVTEVLCKDVELTFDAKPKQELTPPTQAELDELPF